MHITVSPAPSRLPPTVAWRAHVTHVEGAWSRHCGNTMRAMSSTAGHTSRITVIIIVVNIIAVIILHASVPSSAPHGKLTVIEHEVCDRQAAAPRHPLPAQAPHHNATSVHGSWMHSRVASGEQSSRQCRKKDHHTINPSQRCWGPAKQRETVAPPPRTQTNHPTGPIPGQETTPHASPRPITKDPPHRPPN
jgi:hypothetical protein